MGGDVDESFDQRSAEVVVRGLVFRCVGSPFAVVAVVVAAVVAQSTQKKEAIVLVYCCSV